MLSCPTWTATTEQMKCVMWEEAARTGGKSQLEHTEKVLHVSDICNRLHDDLDEARESNVRGAWSNRMMKLDMHNT